MGQVGLDRPRPEKTPALGFAEQVEEEPGLVSVQGRARQRAGAR